MLFEKVTVVITATDESASLIETVDTIVESCEISDIDSFLVVIPPNAHIECLEAINFLKEKYSNMVKKLVQYHPYIGGAMRDSIEATSSSHIMFLSADIPTNLESVHIMIEKAKRNPDTIIKISRWLEKNSFYGYNKSKKTFNFLAQKFLRILFNSSLTDFTSPVLIAPTAIYKNICFREWNFPCLLEAVLIPLRAGYEFEEFAAKCYSRKEGKSKNSSWQTMMYLKTAFRVRFTNKKKLLKNPKK